MTEIVQPFGDKVLIKILTSEETVSSGLLVAPVSKENSNKGLVVALGEGVILPDGTIKPLSVKIGDTVLFQKGSGVNFSTGKDDYKILSVRDILGKFVKEEEV